jgi:NAD(P)H-dependent FMN reductase
LKKNIFVIIGSASELSSNELLMRVFSRMTQKDFNVTIFNTLKELPHFNANLSTEDPPKPIAHFRESVLQADGVIICTPEYVFSIPSGLKSAIEWCVATTVFSDKPTGLITASAHGEKGHEELQLIMKTLDAKLTKDTTLLIKGVKGKINRDSQLLDPSTKDCLDKFITAYKYLL